VVIIGWIRRHAWFLVVLVLVFFLPSLAERGATYLYHCNGSAVCSSVRELVSLAIALAFIDFVAKAVHRFLTGEDLR